MKALLLTTVLLAASLLAVDSLMASAKVQSNVTIDRIELLDSKTK